MAVDNQNSGNWSVMSEASLAKNFPLHRACRDGDVAALSALLQQAATQAHLTLEDTYYGWTPTHWAAYFGKLECLKALVASSQAVHPGMTTSRFTQTPAHIAAFAGHPHCLLWLLQTGVNPNARDYLGETSLHKAARTGSMECVNVLLSNKVQVGIPNNNGQTAAQLANSCSHTDLANYLLQVEGKQGQTQTNGSISRSVPSHGLNGGVFPHSPGLGLPGAQKADTPTNGFLAQSCQNGRNAVNGANSTCTSSNGYYGFQATNSPPAEALNGHHTNGATKPSSEQPEDCEMETDANPIVEAINGKDKPTQPFLANFMTASQNGISNGHTNGALPAFTSGSAQNGSFTNGSAQNGSFTNGSTQNGSFTNGSAQNGSFTNGSAQNGSFTNGSAQNGSFTNGSTQNGSFTNGIIQNGSFKAANGHNGDMNHANGSPASVVPKILPRLGEDIMLSDGVSKNFIPIAGCKRSREDVYVPEMKRMRTDDGPPVRHFTLQPPPSQPIMKTFEVRQPPSQPPMKQFQEQPPPSQPPMKQFQVQLPPSQPLMKPFTLQPLSKPQGVPTVHGPASSMVDHFLTVKMEDGYENLNFEAMMAEVHGC